LSSEIRQEFNSGPFNILPLVALLKQIFFTVSSSVIVTAHAHCRSPHAIFFLWVGEPRSSNQLSREGSWGIASRLSWMRLEAYRVFTVWYVRQRCRRTKGYVEGWCNLAACEVSPFSYRWAWSYYRKPLENLCVLLPLRDLPHLWLTVHAMRRHGQI